MSWRNLIWMLIILSLAGLAFFLARGRRPQIQSTDPAVEDLAGAVKAYKLIKQRSYLPPTTQQACQGAIDGMARQVDQYSRYISSAKSDRFDRRLDGTVEGTGLLIAETDQKLLTLGPLPESPALAAEIFGVQEILAIDGIQAKYLTCDRARELLAQPAKTNVALRLRNAEGKEYPRRLKCRRFDIETVAGIVRDEAGRWDCVLDEQADIHYLRISEFVERTPRELRAMYRSLGTPAAVVLDLRGNPGGALDAAVGVAEAFLSKGLIVRTVSRHGTVSSHSAHQAGTFAPAPLAVLIDGRTASAAEIVAGALQIHDRAVLVGQTSHGKWYVQTTVDLGRGLGKMYLTTAQYSLAGAAPIAPTAPDRPDGRARSGLRPDVAVRLDVRVRPRLEMLRLKAMVVRPPGRRPHPGPSTSRSPQLQLKQAIMDCDEQLAEALRLLKLRQLPTTQPAGKRQPPMQEATP